MVRLGVLGKGTGKTGKSRSRSLELVIRRSARLEGALVPGVVDVRIRFKTKMPKTKGPAR